MIDTQNITVLGGNGGHGSISFLTARYAPKGGPDGGDGGIGGNVNLISDSSVWDMSQLRGFQNLQGIRGGDGSGGERHGRDGKSTYVKVPLGTTIYKDVGDGIVWLAELLNNGETYLVAKGGAGGRGNARFATSINKTPVLAETGEDGERRTVTIELNLLIDVAIIGRPNVGKSQLLRDLSGAQVKVADYDFTTQEPARAVVESGWNTYVAAELPGFVSGANQGKGLGSASMKHMRRARVFLHVLDGTRDSLAADFSEVCEEIGLYDRALPEVPQLVVINKVDLPDVRSRVEATQAELNHAGVARHFVSALTGEGVEDLASGLYDLLAAQPVKPRRGKEEGLATIRPRPRNRLPRVSKEGDVFVVSSPQAERLVVLPDLRQFRAKVQLRTELGRLGVIKALEAAGVRHDDTVRIGSREMQWE